MHLRIFCIMALILVFTGCKNPLKVRPEDSALMRQTKLLLAKNPEYLQHPVDGRGTTILHVAIRREALDVVTFLLSYGADPNVVTNTGDTPLHEASRIGVLGEDIARRLIEHKAAIDDSNNAGLTPLHEASNLANAGVLEVLLQKGADANKRTRDGSTALHLAVTQAGDIHETATPLFGHLEIVDLLLSHKAEVNMRNHEGRTALHIAASRGNVETVRLLLQRGADPNAIDTGARTPLHESVIRGYLETTSVILEQGGDVNSKQHAGMTPLHLAMRLGSTELITLLADHGALLNATDVRGWTALHEAAVVGRYEAARILLVRGAGVDVRDSEGQTPLQRTITAGTLNDDAILKAKLKIAQLFLEYSANPNLIDHSGKTVLDYAREYSNQPFEDLLKRSSSVQ